MADRLGVGERFSQEEYPKILSKKLYEFRRRKVLCDVVLVVEEREYLAHRNVLCAASLYFLEIFSEESKSEAIGVRVNLPNTHVIPAIMEDLIQFMYLGEVCVHKDNVRELIAASDYLKMSNLKDIACRFYEKKLNPSNCLSISALADEFKCQSLKASADTYVFHYFVSVSKFEEFKSLNREQVIHIISSDDVNVSEEEQVFEAAMGWLRYDLSNTDRSSDLYEVLRHVRLPLISKYYITDKVETDTEIMSNENCRELVLEAVAFITLQDRSNCYLGKQFQARKSFGTTKIIIACGGSQDQLTTSETLCYIPSADFWYPLSPMINSRDSYDLTIYDGNIYSVAGLHDGSPLKIVECYDFALDKWREVTSLPNALAGHGTSVLNGELYVLGGGIKESSTDAVFKYMKSSNKWISVNKMKVPRRGVCAVTHKNNLYAIGGYGPDGMAVASVERFDPYMNEWAKIFPMYSPRAFASAAVVGNKIYVIGGEYAMWSFYCSAEMFNTVTDEWHAIADAHVPRSFAGIGVINELIYVVGGMTCEGLQSATDDDFVDAIECAEVEIYDTKKNHWDRASPLPIATCGIKCVSTCVPKSVVEERCGAKLN